MPLPKEHYESSNILLLHMPKTGMLSMDFFFPTEQIRNSSCFDKET